MKTTVHKGCNNFWPTRLILPHFRSTLTFTFELDYEWWEGPFTFPIEGWGCKLFSLGKFNYHRGGAGWALLYVDGRVYLYPRYYENVESGVNINHELIVNSRFELRLQIFVQNNKGLFHNNSPSRL